MVSLVRHLVRWLAYFPRLQCLNLPSPMAYRSYQGINEKLLVAYEKVAEESISSECAKIREEAGDVNAVSDTTVAIDGTWQKRGFSSLNGAVVATSLNSKAVEYHVMTKCCKACATCFYVWILVEYCI